MTIAEKGKEIPNELKVMYSEELGIDLDSRKDSEYFKWLLAAYLMGNRISEEIAKRTYRSFEKADLLDPRKITHAGWKRLVEVLDDGGYVRYDYSTASRLPMACQILIDQYGGSLTKLHDEAEDEQDLEDRLQEMQGVGKVSANIFLREMRVVWKKADPEPPEPAKKRAEKLDIDLSPFNRKTKTYMRMESALLRYRHR